MTCQPSSTKCEWAALEHFVNHYNDVNRTAYAHDCCLDRVFRDTPQPEVLCRDRDSDRTLIIESKLLIWPLNDAKAHAAWHKLVVGIEQELNGALDYGRFTLHCSTPDFYDSERISAAAKQMTLAARSVAPTLRMGENRRLESAVKSSLERQHPSDDDANRQGGILFAELNTVARYPLDVDGTPPSFDEAMAKIYASCESKFTGYAGSRRLLELRTISGSMAFELHPTWWSQYFERHVPARCIDEVWFTFCFDHGTNAWKREQIYGSANRSA